MPSLRPAARARPDSAAAAAETGSGLYDLLLDWLSWLVAWLLSRSMQRREYEEPPPPPAPATPPAPPPPTAARQGPPGVSPGRVLRTQQSQCYLVRHGERQDHTPDGYRGPHRSDPPLSRVGQHQARETAQWFRELPKKERPSVVFTSPFRRAVQTAAPIAQALGCPLCVEPAIGEYLCKRQFKQRPKLSMLDAESAAAEYVPLQSSLAEWPEKESSATARLCDAVQRLAEQHPQGSTVIVTHRFAISTVAENFLGRLGSAAVTQVPYCSVTSLLRRRHRDGDDPEKCRWGYKHLCETSHLSECRRIVFKN